MKTGKFIQRVKALFQGWRLARRESRQIKDINRVLLAMFRDIASAQPLLSDRERFNKLVMLRNGCDETAAYEILRIAEESYAAWPQERELTLCDVIHYLAVREFHAMRGDNYGMGGNIASSVKAIVPHKLCRSRLRQPYLCERRKMLRANEEGCAANLHR
jgi:hypothetical protein